MCRPFPRFRMASSLLLLPLLAAPPAFAWGHDGHVMINRLAGAALPPDVPEFLRSPAALDALAYYGPEPDRWRSPAEPELNAAQAPEHFIDLEYADLAGPLPAQPLRLHPRPRRRAGQTSRPPTHPGESRPATLCHHRGLPAPAERHARLPRHCSPPNRTPNPPSARSSSSPAGSATTSPTAHSRCIPPSSTTAGSAPTRNGYTTEHHIHAQFESDFVHANIKPADIAPLVAAAKPVVLGDVFEDYL